MCSSRCRASNSGSRAADKVMRLVSVVRWEANQTYAACRLRLKDNMIGPKAEGSLYRTASFAASDATGPLRQFAIDE
jgi:hypothetical protein